MHVEIENDTGCRRKLHFTVGKEEAAAAVNEVTESYVKTREIRGFRKGKAPREHIMRLFGGQIRSDVIRKISTEQFEKAIRENKIRVADFICFSDLDFPEGGEVKFVAEIDVVPEFDIPKYEGIPVDDKDTSVSDEDVDKQIMVFRRSMAKIRDFGADDVAEDGDMVCISYVSKCEDKPLEDVVSDAGVYAKRDLSWVTIGSEYYAIPEIAEKLRGHKVGETVAVTVLFPNDFRKEQLRGKTVEYSCKISRASKSVLPAVDDAEFLKKLNATAADELRKTVRARLVEMAARNDADRRKTQIFNYFAGNVSMEVPEGVLERRTNDNLSRLLRNGLHSGKSKEDLESSKEELTKTARENAWGQLRVEYVLKAIAGKEGIGLSDDELRGALITYATANRMSTKEFRALVNNRSDIENIRDAALEEKVYEFLLGKAEKTAALDKA